MSFKYHRIDKNNAAVLLVDHQAGLLSLVRDIEPHNTRNNQLFFTCCFNGFNEIFVIPCVDLRCLLTISQTIVIL